VDECEEGQEGDDAIGEFDEVTDGSSSSSSSRI